MRRGKGAVAVELLTAVDVTLPIGETDGQKESVLHLGMSLGVRRKVRSGTPYHSPPIEWSLL